MKLNFGIFIFLVIFTNIYCEIITFEKPSSWIQYKRKYRLSFDEQEDNKRREIFEDNVKFINEFNARGDKSFKLGVNKFAHLKSDEHAKGLKMKTRLKTGNSEESTEPNLPVPKAKDWRVYDVISPVRDQGLCGSCYAFSAIEAIESHLAIKTGVLEILSEQEVLDCSHDYGNLGCGGGYTDSVFRFAMHMDIVREEDYRYQERDEKCLPKNLTKHGHRLLSFVDIPEGNEKLLIRTIGHIGPVSIGIDADHDEFRFYQSGIFHLDDCSSKYLDHAVLAVGYQLVDDAKSYIIIKNSWGTDWGEDGYIRIQLGKNMCGIATDASYPIPKL